MTGKTSFVLRVIYAASLLGATCTHAIILWQHGLLYDYRGAPLFTRIFWTSLTFLDPLAALLLFIRPQVGLVLTVGIIMSDVLHNTAVGGLSWNGMYISQVAFLLFVVCTVYIAWRGVFSDPHKEAARTV
jgi:hypothetical protein